MAFALSGLGMPVGAGMSTIPQGNPLQTLMASPAPAQAVPVQAAPALSPIPPQVSGWGSQPAPGGLPSNWAAMLGAPPLPSGGVQMPAPAGAAPQQPTGAPTTPPPMDVTQAQPGQPAATPVAPAPAPTPEMSFGERMMELFSAKDDAGNPTVDKEKAKGIFEDTRIINMMSLMGASLSQGEAPGVAMAKGLAAYQAEDKAQIAAKKAASDQAYQRAQDSFKNKLEIGKLGATMDKNKVDATLKRAQTDAALAKIPLTQAQVLAVQEGIKNDKARLKIAQGQLDVSRGQLALGQTREKREALKASGELEKPIKPETYAKMLLSTQANMDLNMDEETTFSKEQSARMRVNAALPDTMRVYAEATADDVKKINEFVEDPDKTQEEKVTFIQRMKLIYGPNF